MCKMNWTKHPTKHPNTLVVLRMQKGPHGSGYDTTGFAAKQVATMKLCPIPSRRSSQLSCVGLNRKSSPLLAQHQGRGLFYSANKVSCFLHNIKPTRSSCGAMWTNTVNTANHETQVFPHEQGRKLLLLLHWAANVLLCKNELKLPIILPSRGLMLPVTENHTGL